MKKLISILALTLLLTACNNKWDQSDPSADEAWSQEQQEILGKNLLILEEDSENSTALFEVAFRYQQLGDWKQSVSYYEKVLEQNENDWATLNNLASMYETMEDYDKAAEYIRKLYLVDQSSIEVIKDTVRILLKAGDTVNTEEAVANFEKLVIDPANPNADMQEFIAELRADIEEWKAGK
ncbi:MAG: hypothetical protein AAB383_04140 [Patescibacteria group bacterium]